MNKTIKVILQLVSLIISASTIWLACEMKSKILSLIAGAVLEGSHEFYARVGKKE